MLRITRSTDPITIEQLITTIYGPPGVGKSTLAFTSYTPLTLDFDAGAHRAGNRKDVVQIRTWADAANITADDVKGYKTVVIDTAGRALDVLAAEIIAANPKLGRSGGALTLQGFGELKARFIAYMKLLRSFGVDIVLVAHSDEQKNGDDIIERLDITGGSKNEIYKVADAMGRLSIRGGKRLLNFSPTETTFGKNPAGLPVLEVPDFNREPQFLGSITKQIKDTLNRLTAEQQETATALAEWGEKFDGAADAGVLNGMIGEIGNLNGTLKENVGRLLVKVGKSKGFEWDKDAKQFKTNGTNGFNPVAQTNKDGLTSKQAKGIASLIGELKIADADESASKFFNFPLKIDDLSKDAADRFIVELTARSDSDIPF